METPQIPVEVWPLLWEIWRTIKPTLLDMLKWWKEAAALILAGVFILKLRSATRKRGGE